MRPNMIMSMPSTTTASKSTDAVVPQFAEPAKACDLLFVSPVFRISTAPDKP